MKIIVAGLGYVGLTLALTLADVGYKVIGVDKDKKKIEKLNNNQPTLYEPQVRQILTSAISTGNISFTEKIAKVDEKVAYIICVGTPINDQTHEPVLENLRNISTEIGINLKKGDLVILRSTVPVGTSRNFLKPILEKESNLRTPSDFHLATAPERTLQGSALQELKQLSQIIGGINEDSVESAASIFSRMTRTVVRVSSLEAAELIKLLDNTYRDMTIAIGNLCGKICEKLNLDSHEVIEAANYGYSRNKILFPGAGVGGGCLVKDPYLLLSSLDDSINLDMIKTSRKINDSMIEDTIRLIESSYRKTSRSISNSKILVLGFAFKGVPDTDDIRYSPTLPVIEFLKKQGSSLYGYDPLVLHETIKNLGIQPVSEIYGNQKYDCILIMNNNPRFRNIDFKRLEDKSNLPLLVIDGWYLYDSKSLKGLGIRYFALGSHNKLD